MKKRLRLITQAIVLASAMIPLFSADWGLELSNEGGIQDAGEFSLMTDHKETFWMTFPFNRKNTANLAIEGSLYASLPAGSEDLTYFADLDLFRFSASPVNKQGFKFSFDAGRIPMSDATGFILNQKIDGMELRFSFPFGNIDFSSGYTGLLNARSSKSVITADDGIDAVSDDIYAFGSKRVIGKVIIQIPQAIGNIDFVAEGVGQYDLRRFFTSSWQEIIDTAYGTISLSGPMMNKMYYSLTGTYQTGIQELADDGQASENSLLAAARLDLFPAKGNQLFAQFIYSPAPNDFFSGYIPITVQTAGNLFAGGYANLMRASAGWNFNPVKSFNLDFGGKVFMNSGETATQSGTYNATEITGGATIKATSDLRFRFDSSVLLPNSQDLQYETSLKAILEL